ncbi:MAG: TatD family nuclease-associated radical SAM protein [Faecalibacterium sp.]|nr:TatD family nuclease-associated radical SAM protein [Ruminococcus sp.]MCM1391342.1 TatD family nuclease-associated radical SAM protein [Ruminococcus sp.]MCM1484901.1 TatD family nuclease-associated radical SAM protein [Faecalibacterium sp.]
MADIIYTFENGIYFNITNECPCRCVFCIRDRRDAIGEAEKLFHDVMPTKEDIKKAIDEYDFSNADHAVFCGYGEPTNAFDNLIFAAKYIKKLYPKLKLRLNTNGLSDLINGRSTAAEICNVFDSVSVSLNAPTSDEYDKITRNIYPGKAFDAMLKFTADCVKAGANVRMSVVDVIGSEKTEQARKIAESIGADFVCRKFDE